MCLAYTGYCLEQDLRGSNQHYLKYGLSYFREIEDIFVANVTMKKIIFRGKNYFQRAPEMPTEAIVRLALVYVCACVHASLLARLIVPA